MSVIEHVVLDFESELGRSVRIGAGLGASGAGPGERYH